MWVNPLGLAKHNTAASSFSSTPSGMGEEKSKTKNKKLVGQDKNGLINGGEVEEERKNTKKSGVKAIIPMDRSASIYFLSN